jgi:Rrf2 family protein
VKFSTKIRYGLRAMIEIASDDSGSGVYQKDISSNQEISLKYLDHIIHSLKTSGLITNVKGKKSGYALTRKPSEITIFDIHNAFEPGICIIDCLSEHVQCDRRNGCSARGFWGTLNQQIVDYFKSVSLEDLINHELELIDHP